MTPGLWAIVVLALVAGFARGLTGFGIGLIMMPVTAVVLGPRVAVPLLALIEIPVTIWLARTAWHDFDRREVGYLSLAAGLGIPIGIALLLWIDPDIMKRAVAVLVLASAIALWVGFSIKGGPSTVRTLVTGFTAGVLHGSVNLPGPPVILGWLAAQVPGARLRANIILFFLGLMIVVVPGHWVAGLFTPHVLALGAIMAPVFALGTLVGKCCFGRVSEHLFRRIVLGMVTAGAIAGLLGSG